MNLIVFKVTVEFGWGFISRVAGLSKSSPSFFYPPPTTFLGALASVIAKKYDLGEDKGKDVIVELSKNLLAINLKPENCIPLRYSDISRIITIKQTGTLINGKRIPIQFPNVINLVQSFDSPARGKTILVSLADDEPPRITWIVIFRDNVVKVNDKEIVITDDLFWRINRIGAKESIVSVIDVKKFSGIKYSFGRTLTYYSFPYDVSFKEVDRYGEWCIEKYINPFSMTSYNPLQQYTGGEEIIEFYSPIIVSGESSIIIDIPENSCFCKYKVNDIEVIGRCPI